VLKDKIKKNQLRKEHKKQTDSICQTHKEQIKINYEAQFSIDLVGPNIGQWNL